MRPRYRKYLDISDPDKPVIKATRISRYCVFTPSIMTAMKVAVRLDQRMSKGKDIKPRGCVKVNGQQVDYTTIASDIQVLDSDLEALSSKS